VRYVVDHITIKIAKKSKDTPAKCASLGGIHPAKYKVRENYHNLIKEKITLEIIYNAHHQ